MFAIVFGKTKNLYQVAQRATDGGEWIFIPHERLATSFAKVNVHCSIPIQAAEACQNFTDFDVDQVSRSVLVKRDRMFVVRQDIDDLEFNVRDWQPPIGRVLCRSLIGNADWQTNDERGAATNRAFDANPTVVVVDDFLARRQSETGPAFAGCIGTVFGGEERVEDFRQTFWCNAAAAIANRQLNETVGCCGGSNQQRAAFGHRLSSVDDQVHHDPLELIAAGLNLWCLAHFELHCDTVFLQFASEQDQRGFDQGWQIGR